MPANILTDNESPWAGIPPELQRALLASWADGMPPMASALYSRWWQLETWLRSLLYVELKAALGEQWAKALKHAAEKRQQGEELHQYMATPDAHNRLAYTDASLLFEIMDKHWPWFEQFLLPQHVWTGRVEELKAIRNRIGHCRRPHRDDLVRLEQTLRDLNGGAVRATAAFNRRGNADPHWTDAVVEQWVRRQADHTALAAHAVRQYNITFSLDYSRRPWVTSPLEHETISDTPGYIWHARWQNIGAGAFNLRRLWQDLSPHHQAILMLCADTPSVIEVSFAAMEAPERVAEAIGECFQAALRHRKAGEAPDDFTKWQRRYMEIDPRVQVATAWAIITPSLQHVSVFGA